MRGPRTLLSADHVVGHRNGRHCLMRGGEVVLEGATIIHVGHGFDGEVEHRRSYGAALVAPGFVDLDALSDLDTTILGFDNQPAWRKGGSGRAATSSADPMRCVRRPSWRSKSATPLPSSC